MGERDEKLIKLGMEKHKSSREKVIENIEALVDMGLVERNSENYQLSDEGIKFIGNIYKKTSTKS